MGIEQDISTLQEKMEGLWVRVNHLTGEKYGRPSAAPSGIKWRPSSDYQLGRDSSVRVAVGWEEGNILIYENVLQSRVLANRTGILPPNAARYYVLKIA